MAVKDIVVDRTLLNPKFDGYKLSLDVLPIGVLTLESDLDSPKLSSDLYSYQHVKLFGTDNKLFRDPWDDDSIWFINSNWEILRVQLVSHYSLHLSVPNSCYSIPNREDHQSKKNRFPVSLNFPDENWMVICDGTGRLIILKTPNRKDEPAFKCEECYNAEPFGEEKMFRILHSEVYLDGDKQILEVLCEHICQAGGKADQDSVANLEWLTFSAVSGQQFELQRRRTLQTSYVPDYGAVVEKGSKVIVCSEKAVKFTCDSLKPMAEESEERNYKADKQPLYTWSQNGREINICFKLKENTSASDVDYHLGSNSIQVGMISSNEILLSGKLPSKVVLDQCTWNVVDGSLLDVHLKKADDTTWSEVVIGDTRGQFVIADDQIVPFSMEAENDETKQAFNSQELEECDYSENSYVIHCFDGCTHKDEEQISLACHQWLFSSIVANTNLPVICIRHDVDGLVFKPHAHSRGIDWVHVATFNAFGYVQASKQQRKFTVCAPDYSFVAIIEVSKHIFIYRQPCESSVKSRKTMENLRVAKHQMVTLENNDTIEGAVATDTKLFVLTEKNLYCIRVNAN